VKKMSENYIAIDLGADSGRLVLGKLENKKLTYEEIHRFPTKGTYVFGSYRWNVLRFWEEIKVGLKKLANIPNLNIKGMAVDSWGVNLLFLTKDNELAGQPFHYRDSLTETGDKKMRAMLNMDEVFDITGIQEVSYNGLVHLAGMYEKYPDILKRTDKIVMIPDFFNYLLTGKLTTEYTNATTSQIFDARKKIWSDTILKPFGLKSSVFPKVIEPGSLIGNLNSSVKEETGLADIPVYSIASHDTGSAVIGVPTEGKNWAYLSSGTWSLLGVETPQPIINKKAKELNLTNEGGAFNTIRFLKNIMGLWLLQRCKEIWDAEAAKNGDKVTYDQLTKEAESSPANRSIIQVDSSEFFNPKNMIDAIKTHCKDHKQSIPETRGQITRCIYDSLALRYKQVLEMLQDASGMKVEHLHIVGGGSQDRLLSQITANTLGIHVHCGPVEATAAGNILMQAYANKKIKDLAEIRQIIRNSFDIKTYSPK
jgi:rhamnulokinase